MEEKSKNTRIRPGSELLDHGRIPPQAVDLEEAVLGACMIEAEALDKIGDLIYPEVFYKEAHREIYQAITDLRTKNEPVDLLTVVNQLKENETLDIVGGAYYISQLTNRVASSANIETHARIIYQKFMNREIIRISSELIKQAYQDDMDPFDLTESAQDQLTLINTFRGADLQHINEIAIDVFKKIQANLNSKTELTGIPTGIKDLDDHTGGLQNSDLIIIGGETSNGKTSLAITIGKNAAKAGYSVGAWSYEMTKQQLTARIMAPECNVSSKAILMKPLNPIELENVSMKTRQILEKEIYIDDCSSTKFEDLIAGIRIAKRKNNIDIAIIDYLQLITNEIKGKTTEEQVADIANRLKSLAKILDIPIILISQLARDKDNPVPSRSRLKRSGDIENAADVILLVWIPEIYGYETVTIGFTEYNTAKLGHLIVAKGRNIGQADFPLGWNKQMTEFSDYEPVTDPF